MTPSFSGTWASSRNEFSDNECPNLGRASVNDLQGCKNACLEKHNCEAFNYNSATADCILRGCKFPVMAPTSDNHDGYHGFWVCNTDRCPGWKLTLLDGWCCYFFQFNSSWLPAGRVGQLELTVPLWRKNQEEEEECSFQRAIRRTTLSWWRRNAEMWTDRMQRCGYF